MRTVSKEKNSLLNEFMENCVVEDDTNGVTKKEFYKAYLEYVVKQQEGDDKLAYCLKSIQKKIFDKFKVITHSNGHKFHTYPFKIIHLDAEDYKEEPKKNTLSLYKENRKYSDMYTRASIDSVHYFMDEQNYSRAFGQENYMQFKKFYRNYLEYCIQKCIIPMHRNSVYKYFKELGYNIIQKKERGDLWISINKNNAKNDKKEEFKIEDSKPIKTTENKLYVSLEDESSIRSFLRKKCNLAEIKEEFCAMKELYAFFVVLHKDTNISYSEFNQVVSSISLGEDQLINGIEAIRYIPSYQYIEKLEKNKSRCVYSCNNYFERVTKLKDDTLKMLCHLMDIGAYKNDKNIKKEEEIVEDVSVVKEEIKTADNEIEKTNDKSESSNESFDIINNGISEMENEHSVLFYKYHIIKSDLKIIVQKYRDSVHDELKHVFDMYIKLSIENIKDAESKEDVDSIVLSLIEKADNLTKFVKNG